MAEQKIQWLEDLLANAKTNEEREQILKEWEAEKVARAARREEERFNTPTMIDKFINGIALLKKKMLKKRTNDKMMSQNQQRARYYNLRCMSLCRCCRKNWCRLAGSSWLLICCRRWRLCRVCRPMTDRVSNPTFH